jgi:hypothetical protein
MRPLHSVSIAVALFLAVATAACRPAADPVPQAVESGSTPVSTAAIEASATPEATPTEASTTVQMNAEDGSTAALPALPEGSVGSGVAWRTINADDVPDDVRQASQSARQALGAQLLTTLQGAIAENGHVGAVDVCHTQAPGIAEAVSAERGVRVGRTSLRQRNAANVPPAWAAAAVQGGVTQAVWWQGPAGEWGELTPILTAAPCTSCHGTPEALAPGVSEAIASRYPDDQATGFEEGSLRGYFWVEVPASATVTQ